jgi:hypothetical protein
MHSQAIARDIANLNLSLFGIGVTLLTVLISFAISKKDVIKAYSDARKISTMDVSLKGKITNSITYLQYIRKAIIHVSIISAVSLLSYILWWFDVFINNRLIEYIIMGITATSIVYIVVLTTKVMMCFWKYTKV